MRKALPDYQCRSWISFKRLRIVLYNNLLFPHYPHAPSYIIMQCKYCTSTVHLLVLYTFRRLCMGARKLCKLPAHVASTTCARMDATTLQELHLIALLPLSLETVPKEVQVLGDQNALMRKVSWAMTYYKVHEWCKVPKNCLAMLYRLYSQNIVYIYR